MFFYNRRTWQLHASIRQQVFIVGAGEAFKDVPGRVVGEYRSLEAATRDYPERTVFRLI